MKKVLILGRPGSGKSTASRYLVKKIQQKHITTERVNDFYLLKGMFLKDTKHKRFVPTAEGGFNATDFRVFDEVLWAIEERIRDQSKKGVGFFTIEFARTEYQEPLRQFSNEFLHKDTFVLFLDASIETCLYRIRERIAHPKSPDDHTSFSEDKFRIYYAQDNRKYMQQGFQEDFPKVPSVFLDTNNIQLSTFYEKLDTIVQQLGF